MAESVCSRSDIYLCEDWDDKTGRPIVNGWDNNWTVYPPNNNSPVVDETFGYQSGQALRLIVPPSSLGGDNAKATGHVRNFCVIPEGDSGASVHARWYLYFSSGFVFNPGGGGAKLFYIHALDGPAVWRVRFSYIYNGADTTRAIIHVDFNGGSEINPNINTTLLTSGQWYLVEVMIKVNTPGVANGEVRWWVDEVLNGELLNQLVRGTSTDLVDGITIDGFFGGIEVNEHPQQYVWYDNIVVSSQYIGPLVVPTSLVVTQRRMLI